MLNKYTRRAYFGMCILKEKQTKYKKTYKFNQIKIEYYQNKDTFHEGALKKKKCLVKRVFC